MGSNHLTWHEATITKKDRQRKNQHKSVVLWFTGLSGSGKSTLANAVDNELFKQHYQSYCLDGDNIRHGLNRDLTFRNEDRKENIRRIGEVAKLFVDSGQIVSTAFISPFREDRQLVRNMFEKDEFIEIYVKCPINICEERDPKGLYKKARLGEISDFTGISSPYERPNNPEIVIQTDRLSIDESVSIILSHLKDKTILY
ncbi:MULTISPECIES: adenylyl-sulfate kinase [Heyndrickxia]|mgnify:FL=1|jgi:adenylylsulfate kinase|uniref:Adenylyl-sulfate kinase n=1 Tax=Heyndrickxia oleronia TaxID=38875 RepID=A0A8E2LE13_9BACI|nr:adenylyl-sulfate kinase [Heyndrickxia oleronia]NYV65511.1 adenylyl-sulfate kinase [Bacillus sp. Gen3]OJH20556.1 adenylyl-sulfate kinase [Bacillus obstructivus]MBU5210161.1 adenylyl-sulfate kinase [Heyndrickxia oleronia]MCI1592730.1 adenylyl-sulfate kinase [Heyndrickxia oleronia]MCI1614229.1 adenylyl-sulfate kinase [Heyndrickxia oleronia]